MVDFIISWASVSITIFWQSHIILRSTDFTVHPLKSVPPQLIMHLVSLFFTIFTTISTIIHALPAPTTPSSQHLSLHRLQSESHCGIINCPDGGPTGHAFCRTMGCDFCVVVAASPPGTTRYECDGIMMGRNRTVGEIGRAPKPTGLRDHVVKE